MRACWRGAIAPSGAVAADRSGQLQNVGFTEFCRPVEAFGFELRRVSGSHHIYFHPEVPRLLNLQSRNGEAKPYQTAQFLDLVAECDLKMDSRT